MVWVGDRREEMMPVGDQERTCDVQEKIERLIFDLCLFEVLDRI
jgi:hypothetical protein